MTVKDHHPFLLMAVGLSVIMHMLLFLAVRPASGDGLSGRPVPPKTQYLAGTSSNEAEQTGNVRTLWSPVLFSLPSRMGFSRDLLEEKLSTRLTFRQPDDTERFLAVDTHTRDSGPQLRPENLLLTARRQPAPQPPLLNVPSRDDLPSPRRIYMDPALKERLVGGIVLPPELNRPEAETWGVHADISISGEGNIRHVFLERPLESPDMNGHVIRLLHGLRFRSGPEPAEGRVEIYSAAASLSEEPQP